MSMSAIREGEAETIRIGELAERTDTTPETIRYYESLGLLGHAQREGRGHRRYTEESVARLEKIAVLKGLGLSLDDIASVIDLYFGRSKDSSIKGKRKVLEHLRSRLVETDEKIITLQRFRDDLIRGIARIEGVIEVLEGETE